jgi:iron complex transport system substrate-binding protein
MMSGLPAGCARMARGAVLACVMACMLSARSPAAEAGAWVVRDALQRDIGFTQVPRRIITLLPSLTETVCALGACEHLIATDRFSDWPAQVQALPKTGGLDDASVELIVSLKPDLVLLARSQRITERLHDLGVATFALNTQSYADIGRTVQLVGQILQAPARATALEQSINATVDDIGARATAARHGAPLAVYFEVDRGPYAAGPGSFIGELLTRLGTRNIVTPDLGPFPKLNPEYVVRHNPDVIFISPAEAPHLAERPGWDTIRAVRERRLCSFEPVVRDTIVRPGPRVGDGMRALAACLARTAP